jgi:hypothetical protein
MNRFTLLFLLPLAFFPAAALAASNTQPPIKAIVVKHFTNANGMTQSQDFIDIFYSNLCKYLRKNKSALQIVEEAASVPDADAADSLIIEGAFTSLVKPGVIMPGKLGLEINMYRVSDHGLVKAITPIAPFASTFTNKEKNSAEFTGSQAAYIIKQALKNFNLASAVVIAPAANSVQRRGNPVPANALSSDSATHIID